MVVLWGKVLETMRGKKQKFKLIYLAKIIMEQTDGIYVLNMP